MRVLINILIILIFSIAIILPSYAANSATELSGNRDVLDYSMPGAGYIKYIKVEITDADQDLTLYTPYPDNMVCLVGGLYKTPTISTANIKLEDDTYLDVDLADIKKTTTRGGLNFCTAKGESLIMKFSGTFNNALFYIFETNRIIIDNNK